MPCVRPCVSLLLFVLLPVPTVAQPSDSTGERTPAPSEAEKSPVWAALYSLGATVGPVAAGLALLRVEDRSTRIGRVEIATELNQLGAGLLTGGLVVGPAAGHFYADATRQARVGIGIRGVATVVGAGAATLIVLDASLNLFALQRPRLSRTGRVAEDVLAGALIVTAGSALFDIAAAPLSAHRYNEKKGLRARLAPQVHPRLDQVGLAVRIQL
jgi:hypothetical protein